MSSLEVLVGRKVKRGGPAAGKKHIRTPVPASTLSSATQMLGPGDWVPVTTTSRISLSGLSFEETGGEPMIEPLRYGDCIVRLRPARILRESHVLAAGGLWKRVAHGTARQLAER